MTEREQQRIVRRRLAVLRQVAEVVIGFIKGLAQQPQAVRYWTGKRRSWGTETPTILARRRG